jgi:hypothetical protein
MSPSIELKGPEQVWAAPPAKPLDLAVWQAWLAKGRERDQHRKAVLLTILKWSGVVGLLVGVGFFFHLQAASPVNALSKYRDFQFGTGLPAVAKQAEVDLSQAKVVHSRPALMQDLEWRPRNLAASSQKEAAKTVLFSFYGGQLFRVQVDYDRYETEGMTTEDFIEAVSATYGTATKPAAPVKVTQTYGDSEEVLAQWQDPQYRFELIRYSYGPAFKLVGISKELEASAEATDLEAKRLDDQEAPQRDAARLASEAGAAKTKLDNARLVNKPKFRP